MDAALGQYDEGIWKIVQVPKYKPVRISSGMLFYSPQEEIPYPLKEIAKQAGRWRVSAWVSLNRLEKRGRVKNVQGGWQRMHT